MQHQGTSRQGEQGYMMAVLMFAVALVMISLAIAAPTLARELQRERELETVHRAKQYVRAIQLYYRKFGRYPTSVDQLLNTNKIRFLRQKYADPMTGKDDWRLIHVGQNKTQSEGFFGKPLTGIGSLGGGMSGMQSGVGSNTASSFSSSSSSGSGFGSSGSGIGSSASGAPGIGNFNSSGTDSSGSGTNGSSGSGTSSLGGGISSQSATSFAGGGGGPIIGVSSMKEGQSIITVHEKDHYKDWEFFYDPRVEMMNNAGMGGGMTGGSVGSNSVSNFGGSSSSFSNGLGNSNGFGNSSGSSFGGINSGTNSGSGGGTTTSPQQ